MQAVSLHLVTDGASLRSIHVVFLVSKHSRRKPHAERTALYEMT